MAWPVSLRVRILVLVGMLLATGWVAEPSRAAVTLGSALATEPSGSTTCPSFESTHGCLAIDDALPGRELVAPFSGVIVRWGTRLGPETEGQSIRIRVVRRVTAKQFTVVSSGALESVPSGAGTYTFPAELPISGGDQVGLESGSGTAIEWRAPLPGGHTFEYSPTAPLLDGGQTPPPILTIPDTEHTFNVDVEPDCDHDGLGDETQDLDVRSCKPNGFTFGKPMRNRRWGFAKLPVTVPGPGVLTLKGKGVYTLRPLGNLPERFALAAGTINLLVKPKPKMRGKLERSGRAKVRVTVTYVPTGGLPNSATKTLVLRMRLH